MSKVWHKDILKAWQQLHKNAASTIKQVLKAAPQSYFNEKTLINS